MSIGLTQCAKLTVCMTLWVRDFVFCTYKTKGHMLLHGSLLPHVCVSAIFKDKIGASVF